MSTEKVSIIIPAYNKADLTTKAVESCLKQTYQDIEVIVVDDGSTDDTYTKLIPYMNNITYIYQNNNGASSARNKGIKKSSGIYIALLDCDDEYFLKKIEESVKYIKKHNLDMVHTDAYLPNNTNYHDRPPKGSLIWNNFICNSTVVCRKECFNVIGLFDEGLFISADWDMWLRIEEQFDIGYLDKVLSRRA